MSSTRKRTHSQANTAHPPLDTTKNHCTLDEQPQESIKVWYDGYEIPSVSDDLHAVRWLVNSGQEHKGKWMPLSKEGLPLVFATEGIREADQE